MVDFTPVDVLLLAPGSATRVPVLQCADALRAGAVVEVVDVDSDGAVDAAVDRAYASGARLVVAGGDGPLRAVLRRMVRRSLPRGGERPADLPRHRTVPDLPPVGLLPVDPPAETDLVRRLGLPTTPAGVADAVLGGAARRLDLLRNDAGSVTLKAALLGGVDPDGRGVPWAARIDVDDTVLSDGTEALLACGIANTGSLDAVPGLTLVVEAGPTDGLIDVGVAVPVAGRRRPEIQVRRARGRAVAVTPTVDEQEVPFADDGIAGTLTRKRTWWMEHGAWAAYCEE
ncbi:MAG TPA: diacylglycerol kinase family protein [Mycobacteriales bacterium]